MSSKNNIRVHNNYKEYFDKPIDYDVRGYIYSRKGEPMQVYEYMTPFFLSQKAHRSSLMTASMNMRKSGSAASLISNRKI